MRVPISEVEVAQLDTVLPEDLLVLDVREPYEWQAGHVEGAVHVPMMDVPARLAEIPTGKQVLVVCRTGSRSAQVTGFLAAQGRQALNLAGGLQAWQAAGRPMVSETAAAPQVL